MNNGQELNIPEDFVYENPSMREFAYNARAFVQGGSGDDFGGGDGESGGGGDGVDDGSDFF